MTIENSSNKVQYVGDGVVIAFAYTYRADSDADISVYVDSAPVTTGFTLARGENGMGGTVTFATPPAVGGSVVIIREIGVDQEVDYVAYGPFPAETHEGALDKLTMIAQEHGERLSRTVTGPVDSDPATSHELPPYDAGKGLVWLETEQRLVNSDDNFNTIVSEAVASAAEAAASAGEANISSQESAASAGTSQSMAWWAEAEKMTADSYATELVDVFVKEYASNGDGTFTATDTAEYSALHWATKTSNSFVGKVDSVSNFHGLVGGVNNSQVSLKGWHVDSDKGGGVFYWDAVRLRSEHNGGTIISPTVPDVSASNIGDYLNAVGTGIDPEAGSVGVWVRVYTGLPDILAFGAISGQDIGVILELGVSITVLGSYSITTPVVTSTAVDLHIYNPIMVHADVTLNSLILADIKPFTVLGGNFISNTIVRTVGLDKDFTAIQLAVDSVPSKLWQRVEIIIDSGTYAENVYIADKTAASELMGVGVGERAGLHLIGDNGEGTYDTLVDSIMLTSCGGAAFSPSLNFLDFTSSNPKTNEDCSVEFYGCTAGAVNQCKFSAVADKALMSYGSMVSVEGNVFTDDTYNFLLYTKHGGTIVSNTVTKLNSGMSNAGRAKKESINSNGGNVQIADSSALYSGARRKYNTDGIGNGFTYIETEGAFYGARVLNDEVSAYQSYLNSTTDYSTFVVGGGSALSVEHKGLVLTAGGATSDVSQAYLRRANQFSRRTMHNKQQLLAAVNITTLMHNAEFFIHIGSGASGAKIGFKIVPSMAIFGYIESEAGVVTLYELIGITAILGQTLRLNVDVVTKLSEVGSIGSSVRWYAELEDFSFATVSQDNPAASNNDFIWDCNIKSTFTGAVGVVEVGEIRFFR